MKRVCVFCGSRPGVGEVYVDAAVQLGRLLASRGLELVYGGGNVGLMGILADAVMEAGGRVIGVMPDFLVRKEIAHQGITSLEIVTTMHERKQRMAELSDGFVALPGGFGTLDELCEVLTWAQLGIHAKPCALLNVDGFFDPFVDFLAHAARQGFIKPLHLEMLLCDRNPAALLARMQAFQPVYSDKWAKRPAAS
ncbi:MAG: TIGR00730 family Rossman fold protein [Bryobacteraceae bacterium]|nr:TIGR00730 family Rossman fold protein [Bryobacteraceae bacterium]